MKSYYYLNDQKQQVGPLTEEEIRTAGLTPSNYVWCEGMSDWTPAGNVPELQPYLLPNIPGTPPPPIVNSPAPESSEYVPCPNNHLAFAIVMTVLCCVPFGIVAIVKACKVNSLYNEGLYEAAQDMADSARNWCIASLLTGLLVSIIYFFINLAALSL